MIEYRVSDPVKRKTIWPAIDDIYHSVTWQDMWLKIDLHGIDIGLDAFMMLCNAFCYHYAFWEHTKPRFIAFKRFLRLKRKNPLTRVKMQTKTLLAVRKEVDIHETNLFLNPAERTPGRKLELKAWKSILHILEKLQVEKSRKVNANGHC